MDNSTPGDRISSIRKRRGFSQQELAAAAGISLSTVSKAERGEVALRLETLHRIAKALKVNTSALTHPERPEPPDPAPAEQWDDVRDALYRTTPDAEEDPTEAGVLAALAALMPDLAANRYSAIRTVLPALIRDAIALGGDSSPARSRVLNTTAWLLTMTRQWDDAATACRLARDAADDPVDAIAAVNTELWLLLRQGLLDDARQVAVKWADDVEPSFRRAPAAHVAGWGKLMLYAGNALIRDNQPGAAQDALACASAAAARIGREIPLDSSSTRTFGPASVQMIRAETAAIAGKPDVVLSITSRIPRQGLLHAQAAGRMRSRLDVASAHVMLRQHDDAVAVMEEVRAEAPEWLSRQRYARDILTGVIARRRTLPARVRALADAVQLPL